MFNSPRREARLPMVARLVGVGQPRRKQRPAGLGALIARHSGIWRLTYFNRLPETMSNFESGLHSG